MKTIIRVERHNWVDIQISDDEHSEEREREREKEEINY